MNNEFATKFEIEKINDYVVGINGNMGVVLYKNIRNQYSFNTINIAKWKYREYLTIPKKYLQIFDSLQICLSLMPPSSQSKMEFIDCVSIVEADNKLYASNLKNYYNTHYNSIDNMYDVLQLASYCNGFDFATAKRKPTYDIDYQIEKAIKYIIDKNRILYQSKYIDYGIKKINM